MGDRSREIAWEIAWERDRSRSREAGLQSPWWSDGRGLDWRGLDSPLLDSLLDARRSQVLDVFMLQSKYVNDPTHS